MLDDPAADKQRRLLAAFESNSTDQIQEDLGRARWRVTPGDMTLTDQSKSTPERRGSLRALGNRQIKHKRVVTCFSKRSNVFMVMVDQTNGLAGSTALASERIEDELRSLSELLMHETLLLLAMQKKLASQDRRRGSSANRRKTEHA